MSLDTYRPVEEIIDTVMAMRGDITIKLHRQADDAYMGRSWWIDVWCIADNQMQSALMQAFHVPNKDTGELIANRIQQLITARRRVLGT